MEFNPSSNNTEVTIIKSVVLYYLILLLIAVSWVNRELVEPNRVLRIGFTFAFILPLLKFINLAPAVLTAFYSIRLFSISPYGYLPSEPQFYFFLILALFIISSVRGLKQPKVNKGFIALLSLTILSNLISYTTDYNFIMLLLSSLMLCRMINSKDEISMMENAFVIITFCLSIYGLIFYKDFIINSLSIQDSERIYWNDPNYLGSMVAIGIVISFYLLVTVPGKKPLIKLFYLITCILGFAILGVIASRGAIFVAVIPILYILYKNARSTETVLSVILVAVLLAYAYSDFVFFEPLKARFVDEDFYSGSGRMVIWKGSFNTFINSDIFTLILGGGSSFSGIICGKISNSAGVSPHNNFLEILYNYGLAGLTLLILILVQWIRTNSKDILSIALILAFILSSMTLSPLMYLPFWFLITLIEAKTRNCHEAS